MYVDYQGRQIDLNKCFDNCWNKMRDNDLHKLKRELIIPMTISDEDINQWVYICKRMTNLFNLAIYEDFKRKQMHFTNLFIENYSEYIKSEYCELWHKNDFDYRKYRLFISKLFLKSLSVNIENNKNIENLENLECNIIKYFTKNYSAYINYDSNSHYALTKSVFCLRPDILNLLVHSGANIVRRCNKIIDIKQALRMKYSNWKYKYMDDNEKNRLLKVCQLLEKYGKGYNGIVNEICSE